MEVLKKVTTIRMLDVTSFPSHRNVLARRIAQRTEAKVQYHLFAEWRKAKTNLNLD